MIIICPNNNIKISKKVGLKGQDVILLYTVLQKFQVSEQSLNWGRMNAQ